MAGTVEGGKRAAATNKARYGSNFYQVQGRLGGLNGHTGGFASPKLCDGSCDLAKILGLRHKKAQCAGYVGGKISRRVKKVDA